MDIQPGIQVKAEEKSLFELVTILVDNACKYCDPGGKVQVRLNQTPLRQARLEVSNTMLKGATWITAASSIVFTEKTNPITVRFQALVSASPWPKG